MTTKKVLIIGVVLFNLYHVSCMTNVALNKPVVGSSSWMNSAPEKVTDGDPTDRLHEAGHCAHTNKERRPFYRIDLGQPFTVQSFGLHLRRYYPNTTRDSDWEIRVGNDRNHWRNPVCYAFIGYARYKQQTINCTRPLCGRYVSIQRANDLILSAHVCELEVFSGKYIFLFCIFMFNFFL